MGSWERKGQRKVFILCWCAYAGAYLCRTNLSIVMPEMIQRFGWSKASVGWIGSIFFWTYAIGQLINGYLGDRVKSRPFIFTALVLSSFINVSVGFINHLWMIMILWGINGFLLSMLWGPIVKTLFLWFPPEKGTRIAVGISTSMIGGYFLSWGLIGQITAHFSWRFGFWIPGAVVFGFSLLWLWKMKDHPEEEKSSSSASAHEEKKSSLWAIIAYSGLIWISLTCIAQGVIKDGISLWAPTFLAEAQNLDQSSLSFFSLAIPLMSLVGILLAGWLNKKLRYRESRSIFILLFGTALSCLILFMSYRVYLFAGILFLSLSSALAYGANTLLLTIIPLRYTKENMVSTTAGFLDFCSYMGAALGGVMTGWTVDRGGWESVILSWAALAALGGVAVLASGIKGRKVRAEERAGGTPTL